MNTKELDNQYVAHAYGRFDVALTKGQGSTLYDEDGKKYIDFGSGIGVTAFGINDPVWTKAVEEQLHRVQHTSNLYYTAPCAKLAQLLCEKSGMKKVFFGNSGAEANEGAIKFARKYSFDNTRRAQHHHYPCQLIPRPHHYHPGGHWARQLSHGV